MWFDPEFVLFWIGATWMGASIVLYTAIISGITRWNRARQLAARQAELLAEQAMEDSERCVVLMSHSGDRLVYSGDEAIQELNVTDISCLSKHDLDQILANE